MSLVFGQRYKSQLDKVNNFLRTFDNGYYGYISIENNNLCTNIKNNNQCIVNIYDISDIRVTEDNRKVEIFCKSGDCVTGVTGGKYNSMSYRTTSDFDAEGLARDLNALVNAVKDIEEKQSDNNAPEIIITSPDISASYNTYEQNESITIEGKIVSNNEITEVLINGRDVYLDENGHFSMSVSLAAGENAFSVRATDANQQTTTLKFVIERASE